MAELLEFFEFEFVVRGKYLVSRDSLKVDYLTEDVEEAAKIDEDSLGENPDCLSLFVDELCYNLEFEVKPVKKV